MAILRLEHIRREVGDVVILDDISAAVAHGERIGLVGANGSGKTTLLRICAGRDEPDAGTVQRKRGLTVGLLAQESNLDPEFAAQLSLRSAVRAGAHRLEAMEQRLAVLEAGGAESVQSAEYVALRDAFEVTGGYSLDLRVEAALSGLGFAPADWQRRPTELSGGEQTRAALARLLVADPDLLLLDEPTNHLDVAAIEWLETALSARARALIVAAHDRAFLDAVVQRTWELRGRRLTAFRGNYSAYLGQRQERDARARVEADTRAAAAERERELIQRYRSQRKFTKMHEHERRLEAIEEGRVAAPRQARGLALPAAGGLGRSLARAGDVVMSLEDLVAGFASRPVVDVRRLEAMRGDRIGIVGPNGAGKTTLLRTIAGELPPLGGYLRLGANVVPGYLAQVRRSPLAGATVLDALTAATGLDGGPARSHLARFLFRGDDVLKPVDKLSGGERSRLELAVLGTIAGNLLLLDEPTNHLDIPAREALESFLRETPATVILISHDRRLLQAVCRQLWVVAPAEGTAVARVAPFGGGYGEWRAALAEGWTVDLELARRTAQRAGHCPAGGAQPTAGRPTAPARPASTRVRAGARPAVLSKDAYRRRRQSVEEDLTRLGLRKGQLELALSDPAVQSNFVELRRVASELADVDAALGQAEDAWLVLAEQAPR